MKKGTTMNMQTFTVESLNVYRQDELHKASEAVRANRVSVDVANSRRSSRISGVAAAIRNRFAIAQTGSPAPASR